MVLALVGCSYRNSTFSVTAPPNPKLTERQRGYDDWYYDAKRRILSDEVHVAHTTRAGRRCQRRSRGGRELPGSPCK